jgi:uncharacterized membrane protein
MNRLVAVRPMLPTTVWDLLQRTELDWEKIKLQTVDLAIPVGVSELLRARSKVVAEDLRVLLQRALELMLQTRMKTVSME